MTLVDVCLVDYKELLGIDKYTLKLSRLSLRPRVLGSSRSVSSLEVPGENPRASHDSATSREVRLTLNCSRCLLHVTPIRYTRIFTLKTLC